jgi:hypothetical protein
MSATFQVGGLSLAFHAGPRGVQQVQVTCSSGNSETLDLLGFLGLLALAWPDLTRRLGYRGWISNALASVFHDHLDVCERCRDNPLLLCAKGAALMQAFARAEDRQVAHAPSVFSSTTPDEGGT